MRHKKAVQCAAVRSRNDLQDHEGDVQRAFTEVRTFAAKYALDCQIVHYFDLAEAERATLSNFTPEGDGSAADLRKLAGQLEWQLAELRNMELWSDAYGYDNSHNGCMLVAFNVMICDEAVRDEHDRAKYIDHDVYVARLTKQEEAWK